METNEQLHQVQGMMVYLCSLAHGLEVLLGRGSESVCFRAGRNVGLGHKIAAKEPDLVKAIAAVQTEMQSMGINWPISPFQKSTEPDLVTDNDGIKEVKLAVQNCIVRCTLARYGFHQKGSICQTKHGMFCGLLDQIHGSKSTMGIIHAGENGCMLKLMIRG